MAKGRTAQPGSEASAKGRCRWAYQDHTGEGFRCILAAEHTGLHDTGEFQWEHDPDYHRQYKVQEAWQGEAHGR